MTEEKCKKCQCILFSRHDCSSLPILEDQWRGFFQGLPLVADSCVNLTLCQILFVKTWAVELRNSTTQMLIAIKGSSFCSLEPCWESSGFEDSQALDWVGFLDKVSWLFKVRFPWQTDFRAGSFTISKSNLSALTSLLVRLDFRVDSSVRLISYCLGWLISCRHRSEERLNNVPTAPRWACERDVKFKTRGRSR